jgi:hypothetical protein
LALFLPLKPARGINEGLRTIHIDRVGGCRTGRRGAGWGPRGG